MRGDKILIGLTRTNLGKRRFIADAEEAVLVRITPKSGDALSIRKSFDQAASLEKDERSSTVFLLEEDELPDWGLLEIFLGDDSAPLFSKRIRF
jgi:hypothetical protein